MLSPADVIVDNREHPTSLTVSLRASKTDVFQAGHSLLVGATENLLCPVAAVLGYLATRPNVSGLLFIHEDGSPLSLISGASRTGSPCLGGKLRFVSVL